MLVVKLIAGYSVQATVFTNKALQNGFKNLFVAFQTINFCTVVFE